MPSLFKTLALPISEKKVSKQAINATIVILIYIFNYSLNVWGFGVLGFWGFGGRLLPDKSILGTALR